MKIQKSSRKGFTLIELLTVIAIIGILAGLASQAIPMAMNKANQLSASSKLRDISQAIYGLRVDGNIIKQGSDPESYKASTVAEFAEVLARYTGVNKGATWIVGPDEDDYDTVPSHVLSEIDDGTNELSGAISWSVVVNAKKNGIKDQSAYPVAWLRGLSTGGEWDEDAPFEGKFGLIAFADGHVQSYTNGNLKRDEDKLTSFDGKTTTTSYSDAIGTSSSGNTKPTVLEGKD